MTKNVLLWDGEWERTQQIAENLKKLEKGGKTGSLLATTKANRGMRVWAKAFKNKPFLPASNTTLFLQSLCPQTRVNPKFCVKSI